MAIIWDNKAINTKTETKKTLAVQADTPVSKRVFLQTNKTYIQLDIATIQYLEAAGNYTKIITTTDTISIREKISELLSMLVVQIINT